MKRNKQRTRIVGVSGDLNTGKNSVDINVEGNLNMDSINNGVDVIGVDGDLAIGEGCSGVVSVCAIGGNPGSSYSSLFAKQPSATPKTQHSPDEEVFFGTTLKHFNIDTSPKNPLKNLTLVINDTKTHPDDSHLHFALIFKDIGIATKYREIFKKCNYDMITYGGESGCHFKDFATLKLACDKLVKDGILEKNHVQNYLQDVQKYLQDKHLTAPEPTSYKLR